MKKIFALILCLMAILAILTACKDSKDEDNGAIIPVYLSTEIYSFDPAEAYVDDASVKILGLIYEGLFKTDDNGKTVKAMAKSVKVLDDPDKNYYAIEITLKNTSWSDGRQVQAADYVYAFKRILEPEFAGEGASMLYDIKNARAVKRGDASIDDLGVYDEDLTVLKIEFETAIDYNQFYEYLASPLLVPLREDAVNKAENWSSNMSILVCDGPFVVRTFSPGSSLVLERNIYYYRDIEEDKLTKNVVPYRLVVNFQRSEEENLQSFASGEYAFISEIALDKRGEYADKVKTADMMTEMSCIFNCRTEPLDKAEVRQALSLALDRQAIADIIVFAAPAKGLITDGVYESGYKSDMFRNKGGDLISSSADVNKAKSLLSSAGVSGGSITLTVRDNNVDKAVADYIKTVWDGLGFTVEIKALSYTKYENKAEYDLVKDNYIDAYKNSDFDVILVDYQMFATNAFPNLAQFAVNFAGGKMDLASGDFNLVPHVSGYSSTEYNDLIETAFAKKNMKDRAAYLHQAEEMLLEDAPIAPLVVYKHAYMVNSDLKKVYTSYFGFNLFAKSNLKNYKAYLETTPMKEEVIS